MAIKKQRSSLSKRNTKVFFLLQHLARCSECGLLFDYRSKTRVTAKYKDTRYTYDLETPSRYYHCYGMQRERLRRRERSYIRADRLEELVWREVKAVVQNPDLIVKGMEAIGERGHGGLEKRITHAERKLGMVQKEEDRAIGLYVSDKITEDQLNHQRRLIHERLEAARSRLYDYRSQGSAAAERKVLMGEHRRVVPQDWRSIG